MGEKIYLDTNQLYYIRKIAEEAQGWDYGDYSWAYGYFRGNPEMIADIRALCYIVALQYEWDLEFCASDASYTELCRGLGNRARRTREMWELFVATQTDETLKQLPQTGDNPMQGQLFNLKSISDRLRFITDRADREIVRDLITKDANVLLTSDGDILEHKSKLAEIGIRVMRPAEWLNNFLKDISGNEDGVGWIERILFSVG
jgi:hypothetical protein